ncbi:hypothetical protein [Sulfurimonas sp.]
MQKITNSIKILFFSEFLIVLLYLYNKDIFANVQVAFLSSFFIILGSSFAYKRMVNSQVDSQHYEDKRDLLDEIEDPHELYDDNENEEINNAPAEELDLKAIVKEEKAKIKTFSIKSIKHGARGSVSLFRLVPYIFLILGFIALKNNELLHLAYYLPSLLGGIVVGSVISKEIIS